MGERALFPLLAPAGGDPTSSSLKFEWEPWRFSVHVSKVSSVTSLVLPSFPKVLKGCFSSEQAVFFAQRSRAWEQWKDGCSRFSGPAVIDMKSGYVEFPRAKQFLCPESYQPPLSHAKFQTESRHAESSSEFPVATRSARAARSSRQKKATSVHLRASGSERERFLPFRLMRCFADGCGKKRQARNNETSGDGIMLILLEGGKGYY